jgi:hypothetical protein
LDFVQLVLLCGVVIVDQGVAVGKLGFSELVLLLVLLSLLMSPMFETVGSLLLTSLARVCGLFGEDLLLAWHWDPPVCSEAHRLSRMVEKQVNLRHHRHRRPSAPPYVIGSVAGDEADDFVQAQSLRMNPTS